ADGGQTLFGPKWDFIDTVAWASDGKALIVAGSARTPGGGGNQIWRLSYPDGTIERVTNDLAAYRQISVTGDGNTIAAIQTEGHYSLWVAPYGEPDRAAKFGGGADATAGRSGFTWLPDGRFVYTSYAGGNVDIWVSDAAGGSARALTASPHYDGGPV